MFSYFELNFIEKFLWENVFQILAKIEMTRNKNRLFGRHFQTVQGFQFFFFLQNSDFFIVHTYKVQISLQNSGGKVVFYGWVPRNPPLGTNVSKSTLVTWVLKIILTKFQVNGSILNQTESDTIMTPLWSWSWMTSKVLLTFLECLKDHPCQISSP